MALLVVITKIQSLLSKNSVSLFGSKCSVFGEV